MTKRTILPLTLVAALVLAAATASADVTVERFTKFGGFKGVGAGETTSTDKLSGLRKREVSSMKMTGGLGKFLSKMAGDMSSDSITDVDRDVVWRLDHAKRTYTESPITLPKGEEQPGQPEQPERRPEEKSTVRVVRSEFDVKDTGERKTINGYDCTRYVITWLLETEDTETKARSTSTMTTDLWNTPETAETKALQEAEQAYTRAYLKKMGLDLDPSSAKQFGTAMMAGFLKSDEKAMEQDLKKLADKMAKVKGYSIATAVRWDVTGSPGEQPQQAPAEQPAGGSGGMDLSKGIGGFLGGLAKKAATPKPSAQQQSGSAPVFDSYTEIRKISTSALGDAEFQVPAGYRLVK